MMQVASYIVNHGKKRPSEEENVVNLRCHGSRGREHHTEIRHKQCRFCHKGRKNVSDHFLISPITDFELTQDSIQDTPRQVRVCNEHKQNGEIVDIAVGSI